LFKAEEPGFVRRRITEFGERLAVGVILKESLDFVEAAIALAFNSLRAAARLIQARIGHVYWILPELLTKSTRRA
jgi:hypothetical protein